LSQCDYWWFAGDVEWCDLRGGACKCGGWEESCVLKGSAVGLEELEDSEPSRLSARYRNGRSLRRSADFDEA